MDQKSLYESQPGAGAETTDTNYFLKGRDDFVIGWIRSCQIQGRLRVAELSVGDGRLSRALLESSCLEELVCADISPSRLRQTSEICGGAAKVHKTAVHFVECNFDTRLEILASNTFDVVVSMDILEHVFDVFNFLQHCRRILKRGGTLILRVPNVAYIRHRVSLLCGSLPVTASWFGKRGDLTAWKESWGWDGGHLHLFTIPIVADLLSDYGFLVRQCHDPGTRFEAVRNVWPNLLYSNPVFIAEKLDK